MIVKFEIVHSVTMSQKPGICVNVLDLDASADEMPFVTELAETVRSFAANYSNSKEKTKTP